MQSLKVKVSRKQSLTFLPVLSRSCVLNKEWAGMLYHHHAHINMYGQTRIHTHTHTYIHAYIHTYVHTYNTPETSGSPPDLVYATMSSLIQLWSGHSLRGGVSPHPHPLPGVQSASGPRGGESVGLEM